MDNVVFYRKYRPNNFADVKNQDIVVKSLKNSILNNNVAHSYIFAGPRGTGKTSMSKIFAKALNCLNLQNGDCCNECKNCKLINSNQSVDVIEMDAASNNGVNDVRNIVDNVHYFPVDLKNKVYIIDEAHMLTTGAWNAFLKTLEEPPKNLVFIFATTEPFKIPATIVSRCQRYNFSRINSKTLFDKIKEVCNLEKVNIEDEATSKIAYLADGSLRDALSILDQVNAYSSSKITTDEIDKIFGLTNIQEKIELLQNIANLKIDVTLKMINDFDSKGIDFYQLCVDIIQVLFDKLIYEKTKNISLLKVLPSTYINFVSIQPKFITKWIEIWQEGLLNIKTNSSKKFFFELICLASTKIFDFDYSAEEEIKPKVKQNSNLNLDKVNFKPQAEKELNFLHKDNQTNIEKKEDTHINLNEKKANFTEEKFNEEKEKNTLEPIEKHSLIAKEIDLNKFNPSDFIGLTQEKIKNLPIFKNSPNTSVVNDKEVVKENETKKINVIDSKQKEVKNSTINDESQNLVNDKIAQQKDNKPKKNKSKPSESDYEYNLFNSVQDSSNEDNKVLKTNSIKPKTIIKEETKETIDSDKANNENDSENIDKKLSLAFNQIAFNKNNSEKIRISDVFDTIKDNVPLSREEGLLVDGRKVIVASNNGFVILYDDEVSANNLNQESESYNFVKYIESKFARPFKVLALTKEQVIKFTNEYKENLNKKNKFSDINIDTIIKVIKENNKSSKDIAIEILGDLIKE